ncbi:transcription factor bHLH36-like isoform X1 [Salvia miltiorrhiza]|uniref:Basic helix-loop-helix transcription factor n=1 Tax=Salvia miltiorrhiza TaxID=226208 RepID=A0A0H3Y7M8_SALMI|nr:transcription factor bHLH36-like isoform X1 [Salvia miltiorrhiza]AKN09638.1 basic helix-loop-helix transcription factor [Salvia miltiorrhiza]
MFPNHHELGFGTPTTTSQGFQIGQDTDYNFLENNLISFSIGTNDTEVSRRKDLELHGKTKKESSSKKVMHRELERKRRQEMSHLYASLSSLLPHHQIKGKHGVCDQIQEAASHIKKMEKKIEELKIRRNKLNGDVETSNGIYNNVIINIVADGMEIIISHSSERSDLGLSRVLAELQWREFDVISSVSTRMKDRFVHKIQVEARDISNLDVLMLRDRLTEAIK